MTSCLIIISHHEAANFLHACLRQVRRFKHPEIEQRIYIIDQSSEETFKEIEGYFRSHDIYVIRSSNLYSGYGIDHFIRTHNITNFDYVVQLHADAFPIHRNWLYLPIKLIEENGFSFVGQLQFISKTSDTIYPPEPFFAMAQCFNVARTKTYEEMSTQAGFTRFHQRERAGFEFANNDWAEWAKDDYWSKGSDDDVVAFHWQDKYKQESKLGLAISGYIEPSFGRIIDDIVFHFGSANEARGVMDKMPELYQQYTNRINTNYSDELIEEMINVAKQNKPPELEILTRNFWDGKLKKSFPPTEALNKRIEELKNI